MKKIYLFAFTFIGSLLWAQVHISFEQNEGYTLGNLHNQNGWEVTESSDGLVENQVISDEYASEGSFSFKNGNEPDYDFQWFPIFGGAFEFESPISSEVEFSISYDVRVTGQNGADFEFTLYGINEEFQYFEPIAGVGIENRGFIYVIKADDYDFDYAQATWEAGDWIHIKIELTSTEIKYFVNDVLDTTLPRFNNIDIVGMNFLHNNFGEDAFYDNIIIESEQLSTTEISVKNNIQIYPNPVANVLKVSLENGQISSLKIFNTSGKLIHENTSKNEINLEHLTSGVYFLQVSTENGEIFNKKILKK